MAVAFDAAAEFERTLTTDPQTWIHTPVGTPRAIVVAVIQLTATDHVLGITYGGVALQRRVRAVDTTGEPGGAELWVLESGVPVGAQTVSVDLDSATTDDMHFVSISLTAAADCQVVDTDSLTGDLINPSLTLNYAGRTCLAIGALFSGRPTVTNFTPNANCTQVHDFDFGAAVAEVFRQTTPGTADFAIGGTTDIVDDVAFVALAISEVAGASGAPTRGNVGTLVTGTGDVTGNMPAHSANSILLAVCETSDPESVPLPSGGWAEAPSSPQGQSVNGNTRLTAFWLRAAAAGTPAPTFSDPGNHIAVRIYEIVGCVTTGSPFHRSAGDVLSAAGSAVGTIPGFTTALVNCLIVGIISTGRDTLTAQVSSPTNASLTSLSEWTDDWTDVGNGGGFAVITGTRAAIGVVSNTTVTLPQADRQARLCFAFHPTSGGNDGGDPALPHRYHRMVLKNTPGASPEINEVLMIVLEGEVAAAGSTIDNPAKMHPSVTHFSPTLVANWPNGVGAVFDADVMYCTLPPSYVPDIATDEARRRGDTLYDKDGQIKEGVIITDGTTGMPLVRGVQKGVCSDGVAVTFDPPFQAVPKVSFPPGGVAYEPRTAFWSGTYDATKPQYEDSQAKDLTPTGFMPSLKLRQIGTTVLVSRNFAGTALTTIDDFDDVSLNAAGANDEIYHVNVFAQAKFRSSTGGAAGVNIKYRIESSSDGGANWSLRYSGQVPQIFTSSLTDVTIVTATIAHTFTVSGMSSGDIFRLTMLGLVTGRAAVVDTANTWVKGRTGSPAGLTYTTVTGDITATKTPDANFKMAWVADGYV